MSSYARSWLPSGLIIGSALSVLLLSGSAVGRSVAERGILLGALFVVVFASLLILSGLVVRLNEPAYRVGLSFSSFVVALMLLFLAVWVASSVASVAIGFALGGVFLLLAGWVTVRVVR